MFTTTVPIHALNALIGCLCIVVLGLTAHGSALEDELESILPSSVKKTGMTFLFWPGCGGLVDMLLFIVLWNLTPWEQGSV
jgi:predicted lysophospholipase L1 biosynthesis ABC-type transport system permease subunit